MKLIEFILPEINNQQIKHQNGIQVQQIGETISLILYNRPLTII